MQSCLNKFASSKFLLLVLLCLFGQIQAEEVKTVLIRTYKVLGATPWDPDSINSGITGSEEAVIYVSQKLANLGYKVLVLGYPPENSVHSAVFANPRYIDVQQDDHTPVDIAIAWRDPFSAHELKARAKLVYLWPHDTCHAQLTDEMIDKFDDVFWLSKWQREQWMSVNPRFGQFTNFYGNGLNPEQFLPITQRKNPFSCIYSSNYARGLSVLLDIWPKVKKQFPKATLDIYYGWQHWGLLAPNQEKYMRAQVDVYELLDVRDHGLVSHHELNRAFENTSLWTYPCIAPETFCITAIRAQMTGCIPVIINGTGLAETVRHGYIANSADEYLATLIKAMKQAEQISLAERKLMKDFILESYTWEKIAQKWDALFQAQADNQKAA
ncbi:MAG: glycosyltransferase [Chlamydiales bacterium]|nr:glycosyltransferase [Chlamydiales bacterium]